MESSEGCSAEKMMEMLVGWLAGWLGGGTMSSLCKKDDDGQGCTEAVFLFGTDNER